MTVLRLIRALVLVALLLALARTISHAGSGVDFATIRDVVGQAVRQLERAVGRG